MIRVAVLGCGAIGSLYAAHLARVEGVEVWVVDPWAEHVAAVREHGLRVTGHRSFVAGVRAVTAAADLPDCAFALVATKARSTRAAVEAAVGALAGAAVVSLQNGLGNEDVIATIVPKVIRGSIVTAGHIGEPGVVTYDAPGRSSFGPFEPSPAPAAEIATLAGLLTQGGLPTEVLADARGPQWMVMLTRRADDTSPTRQLLVLNLDIRRAVAYLNVGGEPLLAQAQLQTVGDTSVLVVPNPSLGPPLRLEARRWVELPP